MEFVRSRLSKTLLISLYKDLLFPRMIEEKMLVLLRQGRISKWFSGIGQEAISVGVTKALEPTDYILPLHRNLGVFTTRGIKLEHLMGQWLGKPMGFTNGRDRSFHFGLPDERIIGMISHLGAMLPVADGLALAAKMDGEHAISVAFIGDGGTSEGDFHEAINVAAVWELPVLFVIENNGYGLSTPAAEQFNVDSLAQRASGYGIEGVSIDGNNILEVYRTVQKLAKKMRKTPQAIILECKTFRMRGHEEASGTKYVPQSLFDAWKAFDPVDQYEHYLLDKQLMSQEEIHAVRDELKDQIQTSVNLALEAPDIQVDENKELADVYTPSRIKLISPGHTHKPLRFVDAIREGLQCAMQQHPDLILMGQDIAEYGGVFKITEEFVEEFGKERVRNTPLCESAIIGTAMGLSLAGKKAVVEMQFADFVSCGFNQIVNNLAKTHYRWGHAPQVVVRMPTGGGMGAGPFHSQSTESWFTHVPGLKVVYPSNPADAKGLLISAIEDGNPIMYFEHKFLYRSISDEVPEGYYHTPIGEAVCVKEGQDITIVTYGAGVHWALETIHNEHWEDRIEVIDLRTLIPWDYPTVQASVKKTGKCMVLYEDTFTGAFGAEIAAHIAEHCFEYLDGPVMRVGSLDSPVPFHPALEQQFLPKNRLTEKLYQLLAY